MATILLHTCCGPCASACAERLRGAGCDVTLFFSNANIAPAEEYVRRREAARRLADLTGIAFVEDTGASHAEWLETVAKGLENEPEGGARCRKCFEFSLRRAAAYAREHGFDTFTTSLTVSPHKRSQTVFEAGRAAGGDAFAEEDFKKRDGFRRSVTLAAEYGLYRQSYCGCEFSRRQSTAVPAGNAASGGPPAGTAAPTRMEAP